MTPPPATPLTPEHLTPEQLEHAKTLEKHPLERYLGRVWNQLPMGAQLRVMKEFTQGLDPVIAALRTDRAALLALAAEAARLRDENGELRIKLEQERNLPSPDYQIACLAADVARLREERDALMSALQQIEAHPHCAYDHPTNYDSSGGSYGIGSADGHRCAANVARAALALLPATPAPRDK